LQKAPHVRILFVHAALFVGAGEAQLMFTGNVPHGAFASSSSLLSKYYVKKEQLDDQIAERLGELSKRLKNWPTRR